MPLISAKLRAWYGSTFGHGLIGAAVLWAALPPLDAVGLWVLAWIAPIWWIALIVRERLADRRPYFKLWLAGFLFWLAALYWLTLPHWLTSFGWVALAFYLGFYLPVFVGLSRVAVHGLRVPAIVAAPVVWTGLELARGHLLSGFTMASLGHTQYRWIGLIQISDLAGAYGVSFVVMFAAACLAAMLPLGGRPRSWRPLAPLVAVLGAVLLYGESRKSTAQATEPRARIALIQGSIDTVLVPPPGTRERTQAQYVRLSEEAVARYGRLDLIVWPETMFAGYLFAYDPNTPAPPDSGLSQAEFHLRLERYSREQRKPLRELAERWATPLLVGIPAYRVGPDGEKLFNSAAFVPLGDGPIGRYDKMHLVAFGEYIPFARYFDWLVQLTPLSTLGTAHTGTTPVAFDLDALRIAPNICYETVIPHVIRGQVAALTRAGREPDVLVNLTNDGWFWGSSELDMHLVCGVFRAVECRKPLLIAANTGFSAWIDGDGRILDKGPRRATDTLLAEVAPDGRSSWYLKHGDLPAGLCLVACAVFAVVGAWQRRLAGTRHPATSCGAGSRHS